MRVVILTENIQPGGLDTFCSTLINAWPDASDSFTLVCNASHPGLDVLRSMVTRPCEFVAHKIFLSWTLSGWLFGRMPFRRLSQPFLRIALFPLQFIALRRLFHRLDGDALLVVNGGFPGGESCRIANIAWANLYRRSGSVQRPNIHNFHNYAVKPRFGFAWYENWIDRRLKRSTNGFVSVSRSCAQSLRVRRSFAESRSIDYIYNGIEVCEDEAGSMLPDIRSMLKIGNVPLCLMLATYELRKGHRFLFEAFARVAQSLPEAHLVVCGGGTKEERAAVEAARCKLAPAANIHLLGFISGGAQLINQADVVAISSQSFESFGLTAVEAMFRGVPVVATRVGGLSEVIGEDEDGGCLVNSDDVNGFAENLVRILKDASLRRALGDRGRRRVETLFSAQRMAKDYKALLTGGAWVYTSDASHSDHPLNT